MAAARAVVAHRMDRLFDLPEDVFEQILLLLTFREKVIARRVCKSWFRVVHHLFKLQTSISLSVFKTPAWKEKDSGWLFESCGHSVGRGFRSAFTYDRTPERWTSDREYKAAFRGFYDAIAFVTKNCDNIQIADIWMVWSRRHSLRIELPDYDEVYDDRCDAECNAFVTKFQHQLQCLHCPMLTVTTDHCFPHLVHLTCKQISTEIRNIFSKIAPKLTALDFGTNLRVLTGRSKMHMENYDHLPQTFSSITLLDEDWDFGVKNAEILRSRCSHNIHTIRNTSTCYDVENSHHFENVRSLQLVRVVRWEERNILSLSGPRLRRLVIGFGSYANLPDDLIFRDLQSLDVHCTPTFAMDMLSRTTDNLSQLCLGVDGAAARVPILLTELSKFKSLTFLSFTYRPTDNLGYNEEQVEEALLRLLRGGSRSTLKAVFVSLGRTACYSQGSRNPEIYDEIDRMKNEESLTFAILSDFYHYYQHCYMLT